MSRRQLAEAYWREELNAEEVELVEASMNLNYINTVGFTLAVRAFETAIKGLK